MLKIHGYMRPKVLFEYSNAFNQGFLELPPALKTRGTSREQLALGTGSRRRCRSQGTAILRKSKTMPRREKKNVQRCTPTTAPVLEGLCKCAFININTCVYIYMCVCENVERFDQHQGATRTNAAEFLNRNLRTPSLIRKGKGKNW
jgi:hypothetical protein